LLSKNVFKRTELNKHHETSPVRMSILGLDSLFSGENYLCLVNINGNQSW